MSDQDTTITQKLFTDHYSSYLAASPTSFHAAAETARILSRAGMRQLDRADEWTFAPGGYFIVDQGAVVAWVLTEQACSTAPSALGFSLVGAHTDSPALKLKPVPGRTSRDGWQELLVEIYGGPLLNSWLDRELILAGQVVDRSGTIHLVRTDPIARVSQLAPHLHREIYTDGLKLDAQQHMQPVWTVDNPEANIIDLVASLCSIDPQDIAATELFFCPEQAPARFGANAEFLAAGRQDNLSSSFAATNAMTRIVRGLQIGENTIPIMALFDHEEIGSASATGARGPLLKNTMERLAFGFSADHNSYQQMVARTSLISADAAHSVHPAYPTKHDPDTRPVMGRGPVLKVDADQSYATSAKGSALWERVCRSAQVPVQYFVSESSMRAGSTIGPALSTALGVTTVDVGIPLLSMHSAREMSHVADTLALSTALEAYWSSNWAQ